MIVLLAGVRVNLASPNFVIKNANMATLEKIVKRDAHALMMLSVTM